MEKSCLHLRFQRLASSILSFFNDNNTTSRFSSPSHLHLRLAGRNWHSVASRVLFSSTKFVHPRRHSITRAGVIATLLVCDRWKANTQTHKNTGFFDHFTERTLPWQPRLDLFLRTSCFLANLTFSSTTPHRLVLIIIL